MLSREEVRQIELAARREHGEDVFCSLCGISAPAHSDDCIVVKLRGEYQAELSRLLAETQAAQQGTNFKLVSV